MLDNLNEAKKKDGCAAMVLLAIMPITTLAAMLTQGPVLQLLWKWFATPLGAPEIQMWHALGLTALLGLARPYRRSPKIDDGELLHTAIASLICNILVHPASALLCGYLCHMMMAK